MTQEHIDQGAPCEAGYCPIALACREALDRLVYVDSLGIVITGTTEFVRTPPAAAEFVRAFDRGKPVQPFTFELEVPA